MSDKAAAQAAKARGNTAFAAGRFDEAITEFTEAIRNDPTDHIFFSNRSGAYTSLKRFDEALADAESCINLKPDWGKGYSRKGAALHGSQKLEEAKQAFEEGLKKEPANQQCKEGLEAVEKELAAPSNPFGKIFGPAMWTKLEANPTTKGWLDSDPRFRSKMQMLSSNPTMANALIQSDPQVQTALSVILGLGTEAFAGAAERGEGGDGPTGMDTSDESPKASPPPPKKPTPAPREEKKAEPPRADLTPEEKEAAEKFAKSEAEKKKGNDAYGKKDLETALTLYNKAIEIDDTNASAYLNLAAVALEKKEYDSAVNYCQKAVDTAREHKRGYDIVAKAFLRMGNTYYAQKRYAEAATAYQSSQLEVGTQAAKDGLRKATEAKAKADREAYIDPVKAQEAKVRGNDHFKEGKWVEAIAEYDEAIKRDPKNPALYSNRAACLQKLMDWGRALEDCETAIKIDPAFVKAYTRLGKIQHFLKQYHKALATYDKGLAIAGEGDQKKELLEAKQQTSYAISQENRSGNVDPARAREAMKDPEIQSILKDPTINRVLQDMQENPASAQGALADADIRAKIEKLVAAGILQIGGPRPAGSRTPGQRD